MTAWRELEEILDNAKLVHENIFGKKIRKKREEKEGDEQKKLISKIKKNLPELWESRLIFHVPNGGGRSKSQAAKLKAEGVRAGVSDIICLIPSICYHGLCIEMKIKPNKPTPGQKKFLESAAEQGYKTAVCYSADEAFEVLEKYLKGGE